MSTEPNGTTRYVHLRLREKPKVRPRLHAKGGVTIAYRITEAEDKNYWLVQFFAEKCSADEHYNKSKGRNKAAGRLRQALNNSGITTANGGVFKHFLYPKSDARTFDIRMIMRSMIEETKDEFQHRFRKFNLLSKHEQQSGVFVTGEFERALDKVESV